MRIIFPGEDLSKTGERDGILIKQQKDLNFTSRLGKIETKIRKLAGKKEGTNYVIQILQSKGIEKNMVSL